MGISIKPATELRTERLKLNAIHSSDFSFVQDLISDPKVREFLGGPVPSDRVSAQFAAYLAGTANVGIWLARLQNSDQTLGLLVLSPHQSGEGYELSYQFFPDFWGNGYAFEACTRVLEHSKTDLQLTRLMAETQTANLASCKLLERLGMIEKCRLTRFNAEQAIYLTP